MDNIEIDKASALEQMYDLMKKEGNYIEVKLLVPKIKDEIRNIKPLGNIVIENVGPLEQAYMINSLEGVIETLRKNPGVIKAECLLKNNFKTYNRTIYKEEEKK